MFIETHAHIYDNQFDADRLPMLQRAWQSNVQQIWMPNCSAETMGGMMNLAKQFPEKCLPMAGLHPCYVKDDFEQELSTVENWLATYPFFAMGEIGLDFYWDLTFMEQQEIAFKAQLGFAKKYQIPVILHTRNSFERATQIIEEQYFEGLKGIFHCFSGTKQDAERAIELGFLLGIGGVVTFKNAGMDKWLSEIDIKNIVLETDCPYLAPVPHRGKRNEVSYIPIIAQKIADLYQMPIENIARATTENALKLIKKTD